MPDVRLSQIFLGVVLKTLMIKLGMLSEMLCRNRVLSQLEEVQNCITTKLVVIFTTKESVSHELNINCKAQKSMGRDKFDRKYSHRKIDTHTNIKLIIYHQTV